LACAPSAVESGKNRGSARKRERNAPMPNPNQTSDQWWVNDQTPDNPYGKSEDYESYLDYLGALDRSLTPAIAAGTLRINVSELNNHPEYKAAAIGALQ